MHIRLWRAATDSPREAMSWSTVACGGVGGGAAPLVSRCADAGFVVVIVVLIVVFRGRCHPARSVVVVSGPQDDDNCLARGHGDCLSPVNWWRRCCSLRADNRSVPLTRCCSFKHDPAVEMSRGRCSSPPWEV